MWKWIKKLFKKKPQLEVKPKPIVKPQEGEVVVDGEINFEALELIKHFEGFYSKAYRCPANVVTIGIGTTIYPDGTKVKMGDICTLEEAFKYLKHDLKNHADENERFFQQYNLKLNSHQKGALISFSYNCGARYLVRRKYFLHKAVLSGSPDEVVKALNLYCYGGGRKLKGLVRRRKSEGHLYKTGEFKPFQ